VILRRLLLLLLYLSVTLFSAEDEEEVENTERFDEVDCISTDSSTRLTIEDVRLTLASLSLYSANNNGCFD
jgi:hypothetical protein